MLIPLFQWLDGHPAVYWAMAAGPTLLLVGWAMAGTQRNLRGRPLRSEPVLGPALLFFVFLLAWRWPYLLAAHELNPDESQHIAGALTLVVDPVFFRSVDGVTSGPLNFYALLPIALVGGPIDYFTARLMALILMAATLVACHRLLLRHAGAAVARLALLPPAVFLATTTDGDFLHYSTEQVPVVLLAVTAWLLVRSFHERRRENWLAAAGFVAGLSPWAKLQVGPLSAALIGWGLWQLARDAGLSPARRARQAATLALATLGPTVIALGLLAGAGQLATFYHRYLVQNIAYVEADLTLARAWGDLQAFALAGGSFPSFALAPLALATLAAIVSLRTRRGPSTLFAAGVILLAAALFAIIAPRRGFLHYFLLLVVPLTVVGGAALGDLWSRLKGARSRRLLAGGVLLLGAVAPLAVRLRQPEPFMFGEFTEHWRHPRRDAANLVHHLAQPGDRLVVWGWGADIHAQSGLPQGVRDTVSYWNIVPSPQQDRYRAQYLEDLHRHEPALFVDTVGPGAFHFQDRARFGHESFPELAEYVRSNYTLVADLGRARVYARPSRVADRGLTDADVARLTAHREWQSAVPIPAPDHIEPPDLTWRQLGLRPVLMMLPPARLEWQLDGTEREFRFDYGYDPVAYTEGRSNGMDFVVELSFPGRPPRPLFHAALDPSRRPADRTVQSARVRIPPAAPGTRLVLRTAPGEFGDNAWDWGYVSQVRFRRSPAYAARDFPGFNRRPSSVDAAVLEPAELDGADVLMMHAPGSLTYRLTGRERRLRFAYGFAPGAYTDGGQSDGALLRVELQQGDVPGRLLFDRHLRPLDEPGDRGELHADLRLGPVRPDDRLVIRFDPGPAGNDSWDWTYLANLRLK